MMGQAIVSTSHTRQTEHGVIPGWSVVTTLRIVDFAKDNLDVPIYRLADGTLVVEGVIPLCKYALCILYNMEQGPNLPPAWHLAADSRFKDYEVATTVRSV